MAEFITLPPNTDPRDVRDLVSNVLADLGLSPLSEDQAARLVIAGIAAQIVAAEIDPKQGADLIWRASHKASEDPHIDAFIGLASEWEDVNSAGRQTINAQISATARELLEDWRDKDPGLAIDFLGDSTP